MRARQLHVSLLASEAWSLVAQASHNLRHRFPDATPEQLADALEGCSICKDGMQARWHATLFSRVMFHELVEMTMLCLAGSSLHNCFQQGSMVHRCEPLPEKLFALGP